MAGRPFVHVHPGRLPDIRGADGLLWSTILCGRPAASCFVMAPGLDTGHVIAIKEFPPLTFAMADSQRPDERTLYRAIFSFYDPILRASLLADIAERYRGDFRQAVEEAVPQDTSRGQVFNFMHSTLQSVALKRIFPVDL
jgi:hypothetical protein